YTDRQTYSARHGSLTVANGDSPARQVAPCPTAAARYHPCNLHPHLTPPALYNLSRWTFVPPRSAVGTRPAHVGQRGQLTRIENLQTESGDSRSGLRRHERSQSVETRPGRYPDGRHQQLPHLPTASLSG